MIAAESNGECDDAIGSEVTLATKTSGDSGRTACWARSRPIDGGVRDTDSLGGHIDRFVERPTCLIRNGTELFLDVFQ